LTKNTGRKSQTEEEKTKPKATQAELDKFSAQISELIGQAANRGEDMTKSIKLATALFCITGSLLFAGGHDPLYNGDGGKGIVIAVPPPHMSNLTPANAWIPQLFQDLITGNMARFSGMTVIDRKNESLTLAEQELSANGNYSEENYVRMGHLTNAQYIVAGTVIPISGQYQINFRVNNTETNEVAASFDKRYPFQNIESGYAAKEVTYELLKGMGVSVTESGRQALLNIRESQTQATVQLAKGMSAEKNGDIVEALGYLYQASETSHTSNEANNRINNVSFSVPQGSIRERAQAGLVLRERWIKIHQDLAAYIARNLVLCLVYDFSNLSDRIDYSSSRVNIRIAPGIQIVQNRATIALWKKINDEWNKVKNEEWAKNIKRIRLPEGRFLYVSYDYIGSETWTYKISIDIVDEYGDRIIGNTESCSVYVENYNGSNYKEWEPLIQSQAKYFTKDGYKIINFRDVPLNKITDTIFPQIKKIELLDPYTESYFGNYLNTDIPVYSYTEWQEWISGQGR
jgi:TolB-like protein